MTRTVTLLGATGRVGRAILDACLDRNFSVRALVRDASRLRPRDSVEVIEGSVLSLADVEEALLGADAAVSALGTAPWAFRTITADAMRVLTERMKRSSAKRLVVVSAYGVGETRSQVGLIYRVPLSLPFPYVQDKLAMERIVRSSGLDWTLVRPWILQAKPARGYEAAETLTHRPSSLTFADVGNFIAEELENRAFVRAAVALSGK